MDPPDYAPPYQRMILDESRFRPNQSSSNPRHVQSENEAEAGIEERAERIQNRARERSAEAVNEIPAQEMARFRCEVDLSLGAFSIHFFRRYIDHTKVTHGVGGGTQHLTVRVSGYVLAVALFLIFAVAYAWWWVVNREVLVCGGRILEGFEALPRRWGGIPSQS